MGDLEHDYDELWKIIESQSPYGVEHHDVETYDLYHPDQYHHSVQDHHPVHGHDQYLRGVLEAHRSTPHHAEAHAHLH